MKKFIKFLSIGTALSLLLGIQSCKDDDPEPAAPTVTGPTGVTAVQVGAKVDVTFTFAAPGAYASSAVVATGGTATIKTAPAAEAIDGSVVVEFTAGTTAGAGSVTLTLTDLQTKTATQTAAINISISAPPTIALNATAGTANPGASVSVTATITAANGAKSLTITGAVSTPASPITLTGATQVVSLAVPANAVVGSTINAVFTVTDNQNLVSSGVTYVITVGDPTIKLEGNLITQTLDATKAYLLKGQVFVPSGVTLTIPEGTVIKGDKATKAVLVVQPGGTLIANGSAAKPIVFTSSQSVGERDRGDWGGIVILGNAWVNQTALPAIEGITPSQTYGNITSPTTNETENSGSLKYVRIEYAGVELTPNNETNSLTLGGVGNGTTVDYVQVSYGGDDGFEWFGGSVNGKHLISHSTWDDDFDTDFGWAGNVQWAVVVRNPFFADQSGSTAFESDNQANANATPSGDAGITRGVFSNVTVFGPRDYNTGTGSGLTSRAISANYTRAMHIRRRSAISIFNSVISGWGGGSTLQGLQMDDQATLDNFTAGRGVLSNNILFYPDPGTTNLPFKSGVAGQDATVAAFWTNGANITEKPASTAAAWSPVAGTPANSVDPPYATYGLDKALFFAEYTAATYPSNPNFAVSSGSLTGQSAGTLFANAKLTGGFFDITLTYKGAFGSTDWTDMWSEFQPQNKVY